MMRIIGAAGALALALMGTSLAAGSAFAQGAVRSTHGDWQMRCEVPPGAKAEQCALLQNVAAEDRPNEKQAYARAEIWRPHRGVAAHLLWGWYGGVKRGDIALEDPPT